MALVWVGCGAREPVELLEGAAWGPLAAEDPLYAGPCAAGAWELEGAAVELSTDGCSPASVGAEAIEPIEPGDPLEIVWWHDFLVAEEPAEGRFTLWVDGALLYEAIEPIPSGWATRTEAFDAPVGGRHVVLRVENHGANTWNLLRLTRL